MRWYYTDWTYLLLVLPAILFAMLASAKVNSTFRRYSQISNRRHMTGYDAARRVLDAHGLYHVRIEHISGNLTDHYDPRAQVIRLSDSVYNAATPAAVGVAAHEAGHAVQHAENYTPLVLRNSVVKVTNIGSKLSMPLILIGILLSGIGRQFIYVAYIGLACYLLCVLFQLITLPTEFNASRRAVAAVSGSGMLDEDEMRGVKKVLRAAAMTYVAALAVSLAQFLRLLVIISSNNRRRD